MEPSAFVIRQSRAHDPAFRMIAANAPLSQIRTCTLCSMKYTFRIRLELSPNHVRQRQRSSGCRGPSFPEWVRDFGSEMVIMQPARSDRSWMRQRYVHIGDQLCNDHERIASSEAVTGRSETCNHTVPVPRRSRNVSTSPPCADADP